MLLASVADQIHALGRSRIRRVGIDGTDGAGKTHFADELARMLEARSECVIRVSIDDFHAPAEKRYARGRHSPGGFYRDSYDYDRFRALLLDPLSPGGNRRFRRAIYDVARELPVTAADETAQDGAILIVDGIFLHRDELAPYWDYSVYLDVRFDVSVPRGASRGYGSPDPDAPENRRYVDGQRLYQAERSPKKRASIVIDNNDLANPFVVSQ